jgi:HAD superfamily hydrolase (TIGR01450 family)
MKVAVVGLGAMGARIVTRLLDGGNEGGNEVLVWNRTPAKLGPLLERGAVAVATPAAAATQAEALITMVADPAALRAVAAGDEGIAAGAHRSLLVIEMSTVGPAAISELAATLPAGTALVDAPVLGSVAEVESGALTVFAGGSPPVVERARPLLAPLGTVVHVGPLGSGAAAKLVANAALFGSVALLGEALALARGLGLSEDAAYQVLVATPLCAQAVRRRPAITAGDYPPRFSLALARKDAELIRAAATGADVELRLVAATRSWLADAEAAGLAERDYTAMLARILSGTNGRRPAAATNGAAHVANEPLDYDGLIVDLDGVVWLGGQAIDGAVEAVAELRARGTRLLFLTNDPSSSREEQAGRLTAIGIETSAGDVMTSAAATARFLADRADLRGRRAFVIGSPAFQREIAAAGFALVPAADAEEAELVVVGGHSGFDFAELRAATRALAQGAQLFAAGRDRVVPTNDGPEPATGAIVAAVETAASVTATAIGKPEPFMFAIAREALAGCRRVAVVGDNLASDIAGAKRAGLAAILVLTGTAQEGDIASAEYQPDLVLPSLAALAAVVGGDSGSRQPLGGRR